MNPFTVAKQCTVFLILLSSLAPQAHGAAKPRVAATGPSTTPSILEPGVSALVNPELAPRLEAWTGEPVTRGNDIKLLVNGTEFYPKRLQMIREARHTIDFQSYLWCDDESGLSVARALAEAKARGVRVRLIMDWTNVLPHKNAYAIIEGAGIELLKYNSAFWGIKDINKRLHEKIMIVDGRETLIGGANMCDEYLNGTLTNPLWQDLEFLVRGPATARMQMQYDSDWNWMATLDLRARMRAKNLNKIYTVYRDPTPTSLEPVGVSNALVLHQQPYRRPGEGGRYADMLTTLMRSARSELVVYVPYLVPNPKFKKALIDTARRGVDVKIFTNSKETNDMAFILANAALTHYGDFLKAGIRIFERTTTTLHAKGILVDGTTLTVGSHNFTHRSFSQNGEGNVLTDDRQAIDRFIRMMNDNMSTFDEVDMDIFRTRIRTLPQQSGLVMGKWLEKLF